MGTICVSRVWIVVVLTVFQDVIQAQESTSAPCECVPYYLCVNGTIKTDGTELIDIRDGFNGFNQNKCPDPIAVCCGIPSANQGPGTSTTQPYPDDTTTPTYPDDTTTPAYPDDNENPPPVPTPSPPIVTATKPPSNSTYPLNRPSRPTLGVGSVIVPKNGCGVRRELAKGATGRVLAPDHGVNTGVTYFAELPWMIAVLVEEPQHKNKAYRFKCGGSLIHPQLVLTAAHCLTGIEPSTIILRGGEWNSQNMDEPEPHQDRRVRNVVVHPNFNPRNLWFDIALLAADAPFNLVKNVDVICLPPQGVALDITRCVASGWGKDKWGEEGDGDYQSVLKKVDLPLIPRDQCQQRLRKTRLGPYFLLHDSFLCAGGEADKDTCQGDGGGPLVCPLPQDHTRWTQVGIVSWGIGCGAYPSVFTKVELFVNWIISQIGILVANQP